MEDPLREEHELACAIANNNTGPPAGYSTFHFNIPYRDSMLKTSLIVGYPNKMFLCELKLGQLIESDMRSRLIRVCLEMYMATLGVKDVRLLGKTW